MIKRIIGGAGFVALFYITLLLNPTFYALLAVFFIAGIYELRNIYMRATAKKQTVLYTIIFTTFIVALGYLSQNNTPFVIYLTALLMLDDVFAYLVGKAIGKHKLSKISPNKTIEGSLGGLLLSPFATIGIMTLLQIVFADYNPNFLSFDFATIGNYNPFGSLITLIIISFVLAILGQIGDLTESWFKRNANIKDSGSIVYGHGGILDRIDSWIFPTILMALIMLFI